MTRLFIEEYGDVEQLRGDLVPIPAAFVTAHFVSITTNSTQSVTINPATNYVRLHSLADCFYSLGTNPTASTNTEHLPAGVFLDRWVGQESAVRIAAVSA